MKKIHDYYLKPGELFVGDQATRVTTLLGSCVAVTMYSPRHRVGSICHGLLPTCRDEHPCNGGCADGGRYVDCSIRLMIDSFLKRGIGKQEIEVKVFGGSDMFTLKKSDTKSKSVGQQNLEKAMQIIEKEGLRVIASDLGGARGRKIYFDTHTGEILLKRLNKTEKLHEKKD
jgi:chemotaxis protein CheD